MFFFSLTPASNGSGVQHNGSVVVVNNTGNGRSDKTTTSIADGKGTASDEDQGNV